MQSVTVFTQDGREIYVERANQAKVSDTQVVGGSSTLDVGFQTDKWSVELRAQFLLSEVTGYRVNDDVAANATSTGE